MKLSLVVLVGIVVILQLLDEGDAYCCYWQAGGVCPDGTQGTPCCAYRPCNLFCCACSGGCRNRGRRGVAGEHPMEVLARPERSGYAVVTLGDVDGDGRMSLEEGLAYLDHLPEKEVVKRSLREMDLDGDGFLSPVEVDPTL